MQCASWSSERVRLSEPRNDFARGVRELATTAATLMVFLSVYTEFQMYEEYQAPQRTEAPLLLCALRRLRRLFIHMKNAVNHCLVTNRLRLFKRSTIASGAFSGEPASKGGCGSYSMPN